MKYLYYILLLLLSFNIFAKSPYIVFVNPASKDDIFFSRMVAFMKEASSDLNIELNVLYADRNYLKSFNVGKEILSNKNKLPDYIILINENNMGEYLLPKIDKLGVKVILINEGFPKEKYKEFGKPKEIFKNWILEYLPDDFTAGYLLGKELINKAIKTKNFDKNGFINIFALLGTTRTTSSLLRGKGLKKSIEEYEGIVKIKLLQSVRANWNMVRSEEIITSALKRYENINIIWSASDEMALGAKKAIEKSKINRKILLGGIDWSLFSFDEVKNGDFVATIGGHFMDAGWALIMAYDDFNGITINNRQLKSKFYVINSENVDLFSKYFKLNYWNNVDFKKFSRFLNKKSTYDFSYESVIKMLELNDESTTK